MKRSLTLVCSLATVLGAGFVTSATTAAAQTPTAEPPSAPAPAGSAPASAGLASSASLAPAGPTKVAVIVFQQAVAQTNEGQRNFAQLRQKFEPKQTQLKTQSDEIDALKKQLQDGSATMSEQEKDAKLKTIDEKTKALQRVAEDDQNDFNSAMNDMYQALAQKVYAVMDAYVKQNGYTLVLDASNQQNSPVLWLNPSTDITKAVVDAYNTKSGVPPQPASTTPAPSATPRSTTPRTGTTTRPSTTKPPQ
jgi:Skp family chaperone for outer membrane proteins